MKEIENNEIVGTHFDSDKTYYRPDLSKMEIGDFDLYTSTFFTYVNLFWNNLIVDINRIENKFRIRVPKYKHDWVNGSSISNQTNGNIFSLEYFQMALSSVFNLYNEHDNEKICVSFSYLFRNNSFSLTVFLNDLKWAISEFEAHKSHDELKNFKEFEILKSVQSFFYKRNYDSFYSHFNGDF